MKTNVFITVLLIVSVTVQGQDIKGIPYILNESFVSNTFGFPANIQNFKKNYGHILAVSKKPLRNLHNNAVIDTIYTFSAGKTTIEFYKASHADFLQSAYIDTDKIQLKYNIRIGCPKADISRLLKTELTGNKIQIGDLEHGQVYTLIFSKGRLAVVSYEAYVD